MHSAYKNKMFKIHFWVYEAPLIPYSYIFYEINPQSETTVVKNKSFDDDLFRCASS